MRLRIGLAAAVLSALPTGLALAQEQAAGTATPDVAALLQRIEEQEQRLRVLERKLELQNEATTAAAASAPVVRASANRFSFQSADGANSIRLRGVLHFDGRRFDDDVTAETADTWILRRVRPIVEGTIANIYDFRFTPDFASGRTVIQDAYVVGRFKPWAQVTAGKFKVPVGLERIQSANDIRFIERGFPTGLLPNRDLGVQIGGDVAGGLVNYSIGYFNGVTDGGSSEGNPTPDVESDTKGDIAARVFFQPFLNSDQFALRGLGFGVGASYVDSTGSATNPLLPSYRTPGQQTAFSYRASVAASGTTPAVNGTFADGERIRWSPQFYYYLKSFGVLGEYANVSQDVSRVVGATTLSDSLDTTAWQLQLSWALTGEEESFRGIVPANSFELGKPGRGAWELVARIQELSIDDAAFAGGLSSFANPLTAARKAKALGVGVNWYLNQSVKWMLNFERTEFDGGAASGDRPNEEALLTRFAIAF
jgi:phosphate-selective porin OprO and OprP